MRITTPPNLFTKKNALITAGALLAVALICAAVWFVVCQQVTSVYKSELQQATASLRQKVDSFPEQFKVLHEKADAKTATETLTAFSKVLEQQRGALPQPSLLFGQHLVGQEQRSQKDKLDNALTQLAETVTQTAKLAEYEQAAATALRAVAGKTGANADEQTALAITWQTLVDQLRALQPPTVASGAHSRLVELTISTQSTLASLPDLYKKKDHAGFTAKQGELNSKINAMREVRESFADIAQAQDGIIARDYQKLRGLLN